MAVCAFPNSKQLTTWAILWIVSAVLLPVRASHGQREKFFELARDMLCIASFDGYFLDLNPAWERNLGFSTAELKAKPFLEFVHADDRAATIAEAEQLAEGRGNTVPFTVTRSRASSTAATSRNRSSASLRERCRRTHRSAS